MTEKQIVCLGIIPQSEIKVFVVAAVLVLVNTDTNTLCTTFNLHNFMIYTLIMLFY